MSDLPVNPQIRDAVRLSHEAVIAPEVTRNQGMGMAYQAVAQATAIAVQDAADYLRNVSMVGATAIAVASAKMVENESPTPWGEIIGEAQKAIDSAVETFHAVGTTAGDIAKHYPAGDRSPE